jgi:hypothetical protein
MGLKVIAYAPPKNGKTVFGLTMAEEGAVGVIDAEGRLQWYTEPLPNAPKRPWPYDNPRRILPSLGCLANPTLAAAFANAHPIYLVETVALEQMRKACKVWNNDPDIFGIDLDSATIAWQQLCATRDTSDEKKSMLSWAPIKEWDNLFKIGLSGGGKHVCMIAHAQEKVKLIRRPDGTSEFVTDKVVPRLEKYSGHWADMTVTFDMKEGAKYPNLVVIDEGTGGAGGLTRGSKLPDPTFAKLLRKLGRLPQVTAVPQADDVGYRNQMELQRLKEGK